MGPLICIALVWFANQVGLDLIPYICQLVWQVAAPEHLKAYRVSQLISLDRTPDNTLLLVRLDR